MIRKFLARILARWANDVLTRQLLQLESELDVERRTIKVLQAELDSMAAVLARDRERIRAESAAYSRQRADAEGTPDVSN